MDEHQLNDLLECSVCLERLDTSSKVLPCQHTFCRKCLEVIFSSRQELRCPECRVVVDIKIDELPPNVLLMRILEGMKNAAAAKTQQQHHHNDSNKLDEVQKLNQEQQQQIKLKQQQQQKQMLQYQQQKQQLKQKQQAVMQQQHHAAAAAMTTAQQQATLQQHHQLQQATAAMITAQKQATQAVMQKHHQQQQAAAAAASAAMSTAQQQATLQQHHQQQQVAATAASINAAAAAAMPTAQQQATLQQHHQQQQAAATAASINAAAAAAMPTAQRRLLLPHAFALYDFDSAEPSDLHFKKGDLVLLRRKIDVNWYVGQLNGVEGTFPVNYVQVIIPLPAPHAFALYDFKMGPNEEEGCLTFKKGTPIHVLRRVDHNWAEGRIGANIGIFPIAFVELNALAKQLLDSFLLQNSTTTTAAAPPPTAAAPPPTAAASAPQQQQQPQPISTHALPNPVAVATISQQSQQQPQPPRNLPPIPLIDPTTNLNPSDSNTSSSNASSNTTSPNSMTTTCSSSISSNSIPSSPNQSQMNTPQHVAATANPVSVASTTSAASSGAVRYRDCKEKRHSLNALLSASVSGGAAAPALSVLQSNRHSAEILSMPSELSPPLNARQRSGADVGLATAVVESTVAAAPQSTVAREQQQTQTPPPARNNVLKSCGPQNVPPTLPWGYLALYPYKPRKADELELKKGCVYNVTERCLDGWFKGKNWQDTSGVFPGNYVSPLRQRDYQQLMHQYKFVPQQQQPLATQQHQQQSSVTATISAKNSNHMESINTRLVGGSSSGDSGTTAAMVVPSLPHQPPDLPPRQITAGSVWTKPLGHTVEAFFNRCSNKTPPTAAATAQQKDVKDSKEKETANSTPAATTSTSASSASSAAVSLMKRLTHIKSRSKSPGSTVAVAAAAAAHQNSPPAQAQLNNYSMDNPTFEDVPPNFSSSGNNNATRDQMHPVHVRSGSCPSQLLQSLPIDLTNLQINENALNQQQQHKHQVSPQATYGSQRVKGSKERPPLQNVRQSMDGTFRSGIYNTASPPPQPPIQQQQQSATANIMPTKCDQQQQQQQQIQSNLIHHRKSQSLDANTLTVAPLPPQTTTAASPSATAPHVASPPTSSTAPCNITAAAIAASATTKSTQNTRESRFRCIVPYPPNSDIELELQVGDLIYVHRKQKNGWYKGTHARTNKTGLFPASFVEPDI